MPLDRRDRLQKVLDSVLRETEEQGKRELQEGEEKPHAVPRAVSLPGATEIIRSVKLTSGPLQEGTGHDRYEDKGV